ncbi:methyltransferase [Acuticoccus sp. MNP-M23]|uniref:methyltransferase n=1 Tax=Acuticoccus sp. MNP-M23 TaxID=3072793 RepID=UPI00281631D5|nr:methyltransferase [Acuticoccus sp. MNP-M23]WMS42147.1 methyltransferase [Acuticoccus sp. MNP-M23]
MGALYDRVARLRDRLVMAPAFHRIVTSLPFGKTIAASQAEATFDVVAGFVYAQTLAALVSLGVLERLAGGPRSTENLAAELDLTPRAVEVMMRAAHAKGLVDRRTGGWGLGMKGAAILGQGGIAEMVAHHHHFYADLADPVALMRGGKPTELAAYWTYTGQSDVPASDDGAATGPESAMPAADAAPYSRLMAASQAFVADAVLHNRPFRRARHLVDLGGGAGAFGIAALKCHKNLTLTVADRPDVVPLAEAALTDAGLDHRADAQAIDFFEDGLAFRADLVSLVRVLHDHDDAAVAVLLGALAHGSPDAALVVIEPMADLARPTGMDAYFPWYFMAMGQGRLRTYDELCALLKAAGYTDIRPLKSKNPVLVRALVARCKPD